MFLRESALIKPYQQCIYALGGGDYLLLHDYQELLKHGIMPEQEILSRHFSYFGLVTEGLLKHINDEHWSEALKSASRVSERAIEDQPHLRFER